MTDDLAERLMLSGLLTVAGCLIFDDGRNGMPWEFAAAMVAMAIGLVMFPFSGQSPDPDGKDAPR